MQLLGARFENVMNHKNIHLRAELGVDLTPLRFKRRKAWLLRTAYGARYCYSPDIAVCGWWWRPDAIVTRLDLDKVTCAKCQQYILRFVKIRKVNPRSGMRMPLRERYEAKAL